MSKTILNIPISIVDTNIFVPKFSKNTTCRKGLYVIRPAIKVSDIFSKIFFDILEKISIKFIKKMSRILGKIMEKNLSKTYLVAIFLDVEKAFDCVSHSELLDELTNINFVDNTVRWFKSYLSNSVVSTRVDSETSTSSLMNMGWPQGTVLSPDLFNILINPVLSVSDIMHSYAFADDTICNRPRPAYYIKRHGSNKWRTKGYSQMVQRSWTGG
jgi:uncharacterized protein YifN (PemK superfamily)